MIRTLNKSLLSVVALLIISGGLLAQPVAKIVGPTQAPAGELVVLSSQGSTGDNLVWVRPETIQSALVGCTVLDTQVFFSTTKVGKYEFMLIAADKEAKISYVRHTVEIKAGGGGSPPTDPPVDPQPPNPAKWAGLVDISKQSAERLNDPPTRARLKSSIAATIVGIQSRCEANQCPTLTEAKALVLTAIESVLLGRTGASTQIDWTAWRKGNQNELDRLGLVDLNDYIGAVKAIASGL